MQRNAAADRSADERIETEPALSVGRVLCELGHVILLSTPLIAALALGAALVSAPPSAMLTGAPLSLPDEIYRFVLRGAW